MPMPSRFSSPNIPPSPQRGMGFAPSEKEMARRKRIGIYGQQLKEIEDKNILGETLNEEDLRLLYAIDLDVTKWMAGWEFVSSKMKGIKKGRDAKEDLSRLLNVPRECITTTVREVLERQGEVVWHEGGLDLRGMTKIESLILPRRVRGFIDLQDLKIAENLVCPEHVDDQILLTNLVSMQGVLLPKYVGGDLDCSDLRSAKNLTCPEYVGGSLFLDTVDRVEGLILPKEVGQDVRLYCLATAQNLVLSEEIGGNLYLNALKKLDAIKGGVFPKIIKGDIHLDALESASRLNIPEHFNRSIYFTKLSAEERRKFQQRFPMAKIK